MHNNWTTNLSSYVALNITNISGFDIAGRLGRQATVALTSLFHSGLSLCIPPESLNQVSFLVAISSDLVRWLRLS